MRSAGSHQAGLLESRLPDTDPDPAEIGAAVREVLEVDLPRLLPWWSAFLTAAETANSPESQRLARIHSEMLAYFVQYYRAHHVAASGFTFQFASGD